MFIVDIETLSTADDARILQISAIKYDDKYNVIDTFNMYPDEHIDQCWIDENTVKWWMTGDRAAMYNHIVSQEREWMFEVLNQFRNFIWSKWSVWANSPSFDLRILWHAFKKFGINDIEYWRHMDIRTIKSYIPIKIKNDHDSLNDCINQLEIVKYFETMLQNALKK